MFFTKMSTMAESTNNLVLCGGVDCRKNESDIHKFTQALCMELRRTGRSVQELNSLARQKGLFNDPSAQIQQLTKAIKENISRHEKSVEQLSMAVDKSTRAKVRAQTTEVLVMQSWLVLDYFLWNYRLLAENIGMQF